MTPMERFGDAARAALTHSNPSNQVEAVATAIANEVDAALEAAAVEQAYNYKRWATEDVEDQYGRGRQDGYQHSLSQISARKGRKLA